MPTVIFVDSSGAQRAVEGRAGQSVMQIAVNHDIPGIEGECGGEMNCGTCHVYVADEWAASLADRAHGEEDLLEMVDDLRPCSRLACQIRFAAELDGLRLTIPGA